jgi:hypothetical protein
LATSNKENESMLLFQGKKEKKISWQAKKQETRKHYPPVCPLLAP